MASPTEAGAEAKQIGQVNANKTHVWQNLTYPGRLNL